MQIFTSCNIHYLVCVHNLTLSVLYLGEQPPLPEANHFVNSFFKKNYMLCDKKSCNLDMLSLLTVFYNKAKALLHLPYNISSFISLQLSTLM